MIRKRIAKTILRFGSFLSSDHSYNLLKMIEYVDSLSADELESLQLLRLQNIISECYDHVPYYKEIFKAYNLKPNDIRSLSDLKKIPILDKNIIRENSSKLINPFVEAKDCVASATGGSTGDPLNFVRDREYIQYGAAGMWRALCRCGWQPGDNIGYVWGCSQDYYKKSQAGRVLRSFLSRIWWFDTFNASEKNIAHWVKVIKRVKPTVMFGYAASLDQLASYIIKHQVELCNMKGVFSTAETLFDEARSNIEKAFGCKAYNFYGSSEILNIACECPQGKMHINSDFVVVEEGEGIDGGRNELIITSLMNKAQPFIRYINGDMGKLSVENCECGLPYPLLSLNVGRIGNIINLPNGNSVSGRYFACFIFGTNGIKSFQIHQKSLDNFVLRIVRSEDFNAQTESKLRMVENILRDKGGSLKVNIEYVDAIPLTRQGKHLHIISDLTNDN